jgi:hypothetical protein
MYTSGVKLMYSYSTWRLVDFLKPETSSDSGLRLDYTGKETTLASVKNLLYVKWARIPRPDGVVRYLVLSSGLVPSTNPYIILLNLA